MKLPERNLDVLRSVAVLCVFFSHFSLVFPGSRLTRALMMQLGQAGVLLFFVHTSLVLMASIGRSGQHGHWIRAFYLRRAFRIYPLAMATVVLAVLVGIPNKTLERGVHLVAQFPSVRTLVSNLLLVQNLTRTRDVLGPMWSLPIEVDMYLVLPFCYLATRSRPAMALVLVGLVGAHVAMSSEAVPGLWRLNVLHYGPCFFAGVLAYHLFRRGAKPIVSAPFLGLALLAAIIVAPVPNDAPWTFAMGWVPCLILGAALPWIAELSPSLLTRMAKTIATYSYGIYLLHVVVLWIAFDIGGALSLPLQLAIVALGMPLSAWAAYRYVEYPGIQLGQRLTHTPKTLASTQPVP